MHGATSTQENSVTKWWPKSLNLGHTCINTIQKQILMVVTLIIENLVKDLDFKSLEEDLHLI